MSNYYEYMNGKVATDISEANPSNNETDSPALPGYGSVNNGLEKLPVGASEETAPIDHSEVVEDDPASDIIKTVAKPSEEDAPELPPSLKTDKPASKEELNHEVDEWKAKLANAKEDELRGMLDTIEAMTDETRQNALMQIFREECDKRAANYNERLNNGEWI